MKHLRQGFTLIELVVVITILGILSVVAIPKYMNLSTDAYQATTKGIAGALESSSAANYVMRSANSARGTVISNCLNMASLLQNSLPTGYTLNNSAIASGSSAVCIVTAPSATITVAFQGVGVS